jgi:hypothetical protein
MTFLYFDPEIEQIIEQYAREVIEEKIRSAWVYTPYDDQGFEMRICILSAVSSIG